MYNQYEELEKILNKIEYLEEAQKHIPIVKKKNVIIDNNFIGKKFNMLTVLEKTDKRAKNGAILYKCQCDCGNIVFYCTTDFRRNTSCGCWRKSKGRADKMKQSMKWFENTMIKSLENRKINSNNTSGYTGVHYSKWKKKWEAYLKVQGKNIYLGAFDLKEEAIQARKDGEIKYFKPLIDRYKSRKE